MGSKTTIIFVVFISTLTGFFCIPVLLDAALRIRHDERITIMENVALSLKRGVSEFDFSPGKNDELCPNKPDVEIWIMFIIYDTWAQPRIWEDFFRRELSLEARKCSKHKVRTVTHYGEIPDESLMKTYPVLNSSLMNEDKLVKCAWGHTVPCMNALLEEAYEKTSAENAFYIWVSGSTIPVKPISYIVAQLENKWRGRSLVCFDKNNVNSYYKHQQWAVVNKEDAKVLVEDPKSLGHWSECTPVALPMQSEAAVLVDDEHCLFKSLREYYGTSEALGRVNNGRQHQRMKKDSDSCATKSTGWMPEGSDIVGEQEYPQSRRPAEYAVINASLFEERIWADEDIWFFRKVNLLTKVKVQNGLGYKPKTDHHMRGAFDAPLLENNDKEEATIDLYSYVTSMFARDFQKFF